MRVLFYGLVLVVMASCQSSNSILKLRSVEKRIMANEDFTNNFIGVLFYDLENQKNLLSINADKYFTPASNIKLLTYYAASQTLPDTATAMEYMIRGDSLIFWGTGDPTFLNRDFDFQPALALLQDTTKTLYYYNKPYEGSYFGAGWAWDDYQYSFSAERSAFPIYGNQCRISYRDTIADVFPPIFEEQFSIVSDTVSTRSRITRNRLSNEFELTQSLTNQEPFERTIPFIYSDELFVNMLIDTLHRPVVIIDSLSLGKKRSVKGYPMDALYTKMLQDSDNLIAEQILIMASNAQSDTLSTMKIIQHTKENFWTEMPDPVRWVDGSGLSRYNLVTPRDFVYVLKQLYEENDYNQLFSLLPAGGKSGTLKNWYAPNESSDSAYIYAKSGTMGNNYSLSGYLITAKGKVLAFSLMNNHYMHRSSTIKRSLEKILEEVRDSY